MRAGGNQGLYNIRLPETVALNGEVHDDGAAGDSRLTSTWSLVSGPAAVSFADASSPVTAAVFTTPGRPQLVPHRSGGERGAVPVCVVRVLREPPVEAVLAAPLESIRRRNRENPRQRGGRGTRRPRTGVAVGVGLEECGVGEGAALGRSTAGPGDGLGRGMPLGPRLVVRQL